MWRLKQDANVCARLPSLNVLSVHTLEEEGRDQKSTNHRYQHLSQLVNGSLNLFSALHNIELNNMIEA